MAEKKSAQEEAEQDMFQSVIEGLLPKITPMIKPATRKFTEFMNDGNTILLRSVNKQVFVYWIKTKDVDKFELKEGAEPAGSYSVDEFIEMIISGKFSDL